CRSSYPRGLQGDFSQRAASLGTFRHILTMEVGSEVFPLGLTGFSKGGSFEFRQEHVLSLAGGVFIPRRRWAYFSVTCNWVDGEGGSTAEEKDAFLRILHNIFRGLRAGSSTWRAQELERPYPAQREGTASGRLDSVPDGRSRLG